MLRVCHVSPTYFSPDSVLGGGERFAEELARAMSRRAKVKLISFGKKASREQVNATLERVILRNWTGSLMTPFSPRLFSELRGADVIHCHQYYVLPTFLAALFGRLQGSKVFVSDLGGGGWTPAYHLDQSRWITAHLPISEYVASSLPGRNKTHHVIYGGVDLERYPMRPELTHDGSVVFLGRILPHKGIHFLVEGLPEDMTLHVIGSPGAPEYLEHLRSLANGKDVRFHFGLGDEEIVPYLQRAMALVHPTPVNSNGSAGAHELFGLALVEAMACGCPIVVSRTGPLIEIVDNQKNGILVAPNSGASLARALERLRRDNSFWLLLATSARRKAELQFSWQAVAERCSHSYRT